MAIIFLGTYTKSGIQLFDIMPDRDLQVGDIVVYPHNPEFYMITDGGTLVITEQVEEQMFRDAAAFDVALLEEG